MNFLNKIKWFIQRGRRGYADCDVWSLDYYLADVISKSVQQLHDTTSGYPASFSTLKDYEEVEDITACYNWKKELLCIAAGFDAIKVIIDDNILDTSSADKLYHGFSSDKTEYEKELDRLITSKEYKESAAYYEKKWEEGSKSFIKNFSSLWD